MPYKTLPEDYFLRRLEWQIFGTLTLREKWSADKRKAKFIVLMRRLSKASGVHWNTLFWVLKVEQTALGEYSHIHFLVGTRPPMAPIASFCRFVHDQWARVGGGISRVVPFIPGLRGREYVLKVFGENLGDDISNVAKDSNEPTLSKSIIAYLRRGF